jgi:hypothetical protein
MTHRVSSSPSLGIVNRRLTYKALTGSELPQTC